MQSTAQADQVSDQTFGVVTRRRHPCCPCLADFGTVPLPALTSRYQFAPAFEMSVMAGRSPSRCEPSIASVRQLSKALRTKSGFIA